MVSASLIEAQKKCTHKKIELNHAVHLSGSRNLYKMKTKNESIKPLVTKEQKEKLKYLSEQNNESMSAYLLRKSMENKTSSYRFISDKIDICNLLNEIYHGLVMSDGRQTEQKMRKIFQTAMKKYGEDFRK